MSKKPAADVQQWQRMLQLIDMKDTLLVMKEFPCPQLLLSDVGLKLQQVQDWFSVYLAKSRSPLKCIRTSACFDYRYKADLGWVGCWTLTLAAKDGSHLTRKSRDVRILVKTFKGKSLDGNENGTVLLRTVCNHKHD